MKQMIRLAVFRNDLRTNDNPLLHAACSGGSSSSSANRFLLPLYVFDERQIDLSALNSKADTKFEKPETWHFKLNRCEEYRAKSATLLS